MDMASNAPQDPGLVGMRRALATERTQRVVLWMWVLLPLLGKLIPFTYLVSLPFLAPGKDPASRKPVPGLGFLAGLTTLYLVYIMGRTMIAGPVETWLEPLEDALPLGLVVWLAAWRLRGPIRLDLGRLYQLLCLSIFSVAVAGSVQFALDPYGHRPALVMGNVLNLAPVLILPAVLCSFSHWAPSRAWRWIGLGAMAVALYTLGELLQTRGPFLVLIGLILLRATLSFGKAAHRDRAPRQGAVILLVLLATLALIAVFGDGLGRFSINAAHAASGGTLQAPEAWRQFDDYSASLRLLMLETGWLAFTEAPFWGHGPQYRFDAAAVHFPPQVTHTFTHLHNDFLTHAVAGGIPAVILFCALLLVPTWIGWNKGHEARQIGLFFTLAFAGTGFLNNVLFVYLTAFNFGLSYVAALLLIEAVATQQSDTGEWQITER